MPDWVDEQPDGMKTLTIRGFEALTVEALRELHGEILRLGAANEELAARVSYLETALRATSDSP